MVRGGQTFGKAIGVLRILAAAENGHTFTDLIAASGQPKATLHRLVQAMIEERLIRYDPEDRRYRLGYGFLELAGLAWSRIDIRVFAGDSLKALSQSSGETVFLEILDGAETMVVDAIDSRRQSGSVAPVTIGRRSGVHRSAAGKAILASLDGVTSGKLLEALPFGSGGWPGVSSRGELAAQLALIRRNGFAMEEAGEDGSCSIAAAVMDSRARPTGAIGVIFPATGTPHRGVAALTRMVTATAAEITSNWGGRRPPPAPVVLPGPPAVLDLSDHEPSWLPEGDVPC